MATAPNLPYSLQTQGFTGATGNTPYKPATVEQAAALQNIYNDKSVTTVPRTVSPNATAINVNFDGTHNNGLYPAEGESPTNIYQLSDLQSRAPGANPDNTIYMSGVGAQTAPTGAVNPVSGNPLGEADISYWQGLPINAGAAATLILTKAFQQLEDRVNSILTDNPNAEIAFNLSGFSRGGAEAVAFANMLNERGIGPYKPGEVRIANLLLLDPVDQTNGALNTTPPTNVDNTLVMVATGEARNIMPAMVVSADARVMAMPVAHSGLGGSYNPQGTSAVALQKAKEFLEAGGSPVAEIPDHLKPDWEQMFIHNSGVNANGALKLGASPTWETDEPNRRYEGSNSSDPSVQAAMSKLPTYTSIPTADDGTAAYTATYPDGKVITKLTQDGKIAEVQISVPQGTGSVTTAYDAKGSLKTTTTKSTDDDGNTLYVTTQADGYITTRLFNSAGNVIEPTPQSDSHDPTDPGSIDAVNGADLQSDNYLNVIDIAALALASHFAGGNLGGAYGAGQLMGFDVLPFNTSSSFLTNADGDIVGEINILPNGYHQIKNLFGEAVYVSDRDGSRGQTLTQAQYEQVQYSQTASAVGLMNSIIGLQHWDGMSDLQRTAAIASIYNVVDKLTGGTLPGDFGGAASVLGLLNALDQGNIGSAMVSGISVVNFFADDMASKAIGSALGGINAANVVPGLSLLLALDSGDPVSVLAAAVNFIPGWGQVASVVITLLGGLFGDDDQPMREGQAQANWDITGNVYVGTTQDVEGGGSTATGWMNGLVQGLQQQLASLIDSDGQPVYGLIPQRLPSMGYQYDPDGMNFRGAQGHLYLKWVDDNGQEQTRYYDGAGNRSDGTGDTLVGDFMARASQAIVPAWQAQTVLAHWQQTAAEQGVEAANTQARQIEGSGLPQELADGIHQTLQALTLVLPTVAASTDALIDMDGDGYLERTQWLAANQQILSIDANGDGQIGPGELLSLNGGAALNSLDWLDANNDNILNARDPAFAALRLWMDVNSDGQSSGETQSLTQVGISAIDFGSNPPAVVRADGSRTALTAQTLLGDILGVSYQAVIGGVLQLDEQKNAAAIATLHAVNTREFDGQAEHIHGGEVDANGADGAALTVQSGDSRLSTTSGNTITTGNNRSTQTSTTLIAGDARLQVGAGGQAASGQAAGQAVGTAQVRSNGVVSGIAFVPSSAASAGDEIRQATEAMVRSATQGLFDAGSVALTAVAVGVAAVQWPTLALAASSPAALTNDATSASLVDSGPVSSVINWQALEGSRVSVTAQDGSAPATPGDAASTSMTFTGSAALASTAGVAVYEVNHVPAFALQAPTATNSIANGMSAAPAPAFLPMSPVSSANAASSLPAVSSSTLIDYPEVHGEQGTATEDTVRRFTEALLLANDSTVNTPARPGEPSLRITSVFAPVHGSVSLQADVSGATEVVFLPAANYHGPASFSYTVSDQYGLSSTATVSLQVAPVNDAPVTTGETAAGDEDYTLQFNAASLLANDLDVDSAVDGDVLRITRVGAAQHGQVFLAADGTVSFIPDANYNGPAQFTYWVGDRGPEQIAANGAGEGYETPATVNLAVLAVNDLPVVAGEVMDSDEDLVLDINPALLLANDTDVDTSPTNDGNAEPAQVLAITGVSNAQHGSVTLLADGTMRFTPEQNYFGAAGFSYTVDDGAGGQVVGQVVVNLAPVNDAPDVVGETVSFNEDDTQTLTQASLLANDSDVDNPHSDLRIVSVENATHGTVGLNPDGSIRFAPAADYFGPAQFTYTVSDGVGGFTVGTASLDIAPVNDAPRLLGETVALDEDTEARFAITSLLANDHDVDNLHAELVVTAAGSATNGSVQIIAGEIVFTPTLNFNGQASFTYTVSDGVGGNSEATVNLNFTPVNDAPVANSELIWGKRDVSYTLSQAALLANDTDVESPNNLQISAIGNVQHGTAALNANGSVSFTPEAGYAGRGSFDYLVRDPDGATSTATAQIDFSRININPTATDDSFIGYEDVVFSITQAQLLVNDLDADNPNTDLRVTAVAGAQNGTVSLDANGTVRFTPTANFHGTASFTYQVSDGEGGNTWAMAQLNVQSVNDAPVVEAIWYGTPIYGYKWGPFGEVDPSLVAVLDEAEARSLLANNQLLTEDPYILVPASYYQNGVLRPYQINLNDGYMSAHSEGNAYEYDDTMRQNGRVIAYDPDGDSSAITLSIGSSPQHGHAWANVFMPSSDPFSSTHETAPAYFAVEAGAWQYYSHASDFYTGADSFIVTVTDGQGASTTATIATTHRSTSSGGMYPIVVDLNGNGIELIRPEDSNVFADVNGDGVSERIGWASNEDGVLTFDANQDGRITEHAEVSFAGYKDGALTDLEGLTAFDTNGDGQLTVADSAWSQFGVLRDANGNGQQDDGELVSLDQLGITAIGLERQGAPRLDHGNVVFGTSDVLWNDGRVSEAGDVMFAGQGVALPQYARDALLLGHATASTETANLERSETAEAPLLVSSIVVPTPPPAFQPTPEHVALLMVQMINTVTGMQETAALAAIETQGGDSLQQALADTQTQWEQASQSQALQFHAA